MHFRFHYINFKYIVLSVAFFYFAKMNNNNKQDDKLKKFSVETIGKRLALVPYKQKNEDNDDEFSIFFVFFVCGFILLLFYFVFFFCLKRTVIEILLRVASKYTMNISGLANDFFAELEHKNKVLIELKGLKREHCQLLYQNLMASMLSDYGIVETIEENKYNEKEKEKEKDKNKEKEGEPGIYSVDNVNENDHDSDRYLHNNKRKDLNNKKVYLNREKIKSHSNDGNSNSNSNFNSNSNSNSNSNVNRNNKKLSKADMNQQCKELGAKKYQEKKDL